jgi:2-polyprenyl-6-methoxyphenol hydroxylase-like FAD-dependent oxidoreductase
MAPITRSVPVLIVGGGPIGLALAADLGRRDVEAVLIEQNDDVVGSPKMIEVSVRTVEFCRQLGIAEQVRDWGFPFDYPLDSVFVTSMHGYELGRIRTPSLGEARSSPESPERTGPCPQTWFDPILQRRARRHRNITLRYNARLVGFEQDTEGVTAIVLDTKRRQHAELRCQYLIGADGYSSTVRELLGIQMRGEPHLDLSMSVYLRIKELRRYHHKGDAYRYVFVGPEGTWLVLTTIDGRDLWRVQVIGVPDRDLEKVDISAMMRRAVGPDIDYIVDDTSFWVRKMVVADRFSDGRVFLAGDSAHAHPPNGGLGMNTGIQDSFDLGWKLAAVLQGWGGPTLLGSYEYERRPASARAATESLKNFRRLTAPRPHPAICDASPEGEALRQTLGRLLVEENEKAWHPMGVHLGYIYDPSPIVIPDGTPRPSDDTVSYVPSAFPGCRAPHVWLARNRSILDLFGHGFALLQFAGVPTAPVEAAAAAHGVPLTVHRISNAEAAELYAKRLVLVRPDGHVAWRGDHAPVDPMAMIDTVRGAGPCVAARRRQISSDTSVRGMNVGAGGIAGH